MKKLLLLLLSIFSCIGDVYSYDFEVDGICYKKLSDNTVEVTYKNRTELFHTTKDYVGDIVIPSGINANGNDYTVVSIGDYAFYGCDSLLSINIPQSVSVIGEDALRGCSGLKKVNLPQGLALIESNAFYDCHSLSSINIPTSVKEIKGAAFWGCENLKSVYIEDLKEWFNVNFNGEGFCNPLYNGADLYVDSVKLTSLTIPDEISDINDYVFNSCTSLKIVIIPEGVKSIGRSAFSNCKNIVSVQIANSVTSIKSAAFWNCESLKYINLPNLTRISDFCFSYCSSLESIDLPSTLNTIEEQAFRDCTNLKQIDIPKGITYIGKWAFAYCKSLSSIDIPKGVTHIYQDTFLYCTGLRKINIPENVTSMDDDAFNNCSLMDSIDIPANVSTIGNYTFAGCTKLRTINCNAVTPPTCGQNTFENVYRNYCVLNVPENSLLTYRNTYPWNEFEKIVGTTGISDVKVDNDIVVSSNAGNINISGTMGGETIELYNIGGSKIKSVKASGGNTTISGLQSGNAYIVKIGGTKVKVAM